MQTTDQAGFVGMKADRDQVDLQPFGLEHDVGARDRQFPHPALAKAAADHDALGIGPGLGLEKAPGHAGQLHGEFLDRAVHHGCGRDIVAGQDFVERALVDLVGGFLAERIVAGFLQRLAPGLQNLLEGPFAGAVAQKSVVVPELDIVIVDIYRRQTGGAVPANARGGRNVFSHRALPCWNRRSQRPGNPMVSGGE